MTALGVSVATGPQVRQQAAEPLATSSAAGIQAHKSCIVEATKLSVMATQLVAQVDSWIEFGEDTSARAASHASQQNRLAVVEREEVFHVHTLLQRKRHACAKKHCRGGEKPRIYRFFSKENKFG